MPDSRITGGGLCNGQDGDPVTDDSFLILFNGHHEPVEFRQNLFTRTGLEATTASAWSHPATSPE